MGGRRSQVDLASAPCLLCGYQRIPFVATNCAQVRKDLAEIAVDIEMIETHPLPCPGRVVGRPAVGSIA
jgi:hypothetical protein